MSQSNEQGEAMNTLLSDEETIAEICKIFDIFPEELEYNLPDGICKEKAMKLLDLINTQKRLYAESVVAEPKAIIAGLAEKLNEMEKLGRKYVRISHITHSISTKLAEQKARIK